MNSSGEKTPPEAPEPRLTDVATILATNSTASSAGTVIWPSRIDWITP